jgi:hypothetical protein
MLRIFSKSGIKRAADVTYSIRTVKLRKMLSLSAVAGDSMWRGLA